MTFNMDFLVFLGTLSPQSATEQTHRRTGEGREAGDVQERARAATASEVSGSPQNVLFILIVKSEKLQMIIYTKTI